MTQMAKIEKLRSFWIEGLEGNAECVQESIKNYGYYEGGDKQWKSEDIAVLNAGGRPHLTINMILPTINLLTGYERQNRQEVSAFPRKGGNRLVAQLFTELCKHTEDVSNAIYERSMMFLDGIVGIKGWINIDIDYEDDPYNGELIIERVNPFDIVEDPGCKSYDLNKGAKYIIRSYWADKELIKITYPKAKDDLEHQKFDDLDKRDIRRPPGGKTSPDLYKARLRETWWRSYEKAVYLVHKMSMERKRVDKSKISLMKHMLEVDRRQAEEEGRMTVFAVAEAVVPVLHCDTTFGKVIVEEVERPFGEMTKFPLQRFVPYWINGICFSPVSNLRSPQDEKNKRRSQSLHLVNTSANSGWFNKKTGGAEKSELEEVGSKPGVVIDYDTTKPDKIVPTPLSHAHITLEQMAGNDIKEISAVNANLLGIGKPEDSGILDRQRQTQGLIGAEVVFDNYKLTQQIYAETLIDLIRHSNVYSAQEIVAIADDKKIEANIDQMVQAMKSIKVGKYGVAILQSPSNPTIRFANFEILMEVARLYEGMIPPDILLDSSDLPRKEEIVERLKQSMEEQKQLMQQQVQAEAQQKRPQQMPRRKLQKV
ncbi:MAG: hypothetical protein Q7J67_00515 [bacterium]|nr:hypothetical protein [bacterium]